jgi:hypothetical protein
VQPPELSATLRQAARAAREVDLRACENSAAGQVIERLVPQIQLALESGVAALGQVLDHYETGDAAPPEVADLSFVARMELLSHQQQLVALHAQTDPAQIVSECGSSRRSLMRGIFAVDRALCAQEGLAFDAADLGAFELGQSLRVRADYARFRRDLLSLGQPELTGVSQYLERATNRLGALIHGSSFDDFRLDDRLMMHRLHARLSAWLDGSDGRDTKSGLRMWQDLAGFVSLLVQVNHRTELVEHDRAVVADAHRELFEGKVRTSVPAGLVKRLETLYGRDDTVDGILDSGMGQFAVEWQEPLERLKASLGLAEDPAEGGAEDAGP